MVSVLIVNDQSLQRLALRVLLSAESGLTVVGEAASGSTRSCAHHSVPTSSS
ncbi:hypothetical protein ACFW93_41680 [Streptomyces canus]|uniref:hypothetical protein n=1 Tax=Streptomyces canus TaxID=58343 RepID=UPI0036B71113